MAIIVHILTPKNLSISHQQLAIEDEETTQVIALTDISAIIVENCFCRLSCAVQLRLAENNIPFIICNEKHLPTVQSLGLYDHYHVTKRILEQTGWQEKAKNLLWRGIVFTKIKHQKEVLIFLDKAPVSIARMEAYQVNILEEKTLPDAQEAVGARIYFQALFGSSFTRSGEGGINSLLNYGYMVLRAVICSRIVAKGFHPSLGLHHCSQFNAFNLADDIIEVFRPMVDYLAYFQAEKDGSLSKEARQSLLLVLTQPVFWQNQKVELRRCIDLWLDYMAHVLHSDGGEEEQPWEQMLDHIPQLQVSAYEY